jgi:putative addiction module component (TIGR02574 family)
MEGTMPDPTEVFDRALSLDIRDRAALAQQLLASLEDLTSEESDRLWADEAQRRLVAHREGQARVVPAEEVAAAAAKKFR